MERVQHGKGDLLGVLAAAWIGGLGGLFVGVLGTGTTLIHITQYHPYGTPDGYYASGTVYGLVGGAFLGSLIGLAAGAALVRRFGNRRAALLGGTVALVGVAVYGRFADGLAGAVESVFMSDPAAGALLAAIAFAAAGGVFAAAVRSGSPETGRRAVLQDLFAGGILGSFVGLLGGGFAELATSAWLWPQAFASFSMSVGVLFGFYLGAGVGAAVAVLVGAIIRRRHAKRRGQSLAQGVR